MTKLMEPKHITTKDEAAKKRNDVVSFSHFAKKDIELFKQGRHFHLYNNLGAYPKVVDGKPGTYFAVWAPYAYSVSVIGDFNSWDHSRHYLNRRTDNSGIWEGFIPGVKKGDFYKYFVDSLFNGYKMDKIDPFAFLSEVSPKSASIVWDLNYTWHDKEWMNNRHKIIPSNSPMTIYEVHLGSWKRKKKNGKFSTYRDLADSLVDYVQDLGFTHIELMPVMEHPFFGSWGYQSLGYFAASSRFGTPQDLMHLIDACHQKGIGVILDWVPSHFPSDEHGLARFDGTNLYEHLDMHPDWNSCMFKLGRHQVVDFLTSSAFFWLEKYHADGLRVDAVSSMLYLDYSRKAGEWTPNFYGGRENLESIAFIRHLNEEVKAQFPGVLMVAEESTAWTDVSKPSSHGGLSFDMKWNMGWMHDTLQYFSKDPLYRSYHQNDLAFILYYAFSENYILSLSHDEVVHQKKSLLDKMPGSDIDKFPNLRCLYGFMYGHPGKKLLFMGSEIGQWGEWNHDGELEWDLLKYDRHQGIQKWVKDLNMVYRNERALYEGDFTSDGFEWINMGHDKSGVISFIRKSLTTDDLIVVICNFAKKTYHNYAVGVPRGGVWTEILNSDDKKYSGYGIVNKGNTVLTSGHCPGSPCSLSLASPYLAREYTLSLNIPSLSTIFLKCQNIVHPPKLNNKK